MVSVLDSGLSGWDSHPDQGHYDVFSLSASDSQPRCIKLLGTSEFNAGAVTL